MRRCGLVTGAQARCGPVVSRGRRGRNRERWLREHSAEAQGALKPTLAFFATCDSDGLLYLGSHRRGGCDISQVRMDCFQRRLTGALTSVYAVTQVGYRATFRQLRTVYAALCTATSRYCNRHDLLHLLHFLIRSFRSRQALQRTAIPVLTAVHGTNPCKICARLSTT